MDPSILPARPAGRRRARLAWAAVVVVALAACPAALQGEAVAVEYPEGLVHGFLILRDRAGGSVLATGDLLQVPHGSQVTTELVFRFRDGSLHDETAVFSQRGHFRLIRDRLVQRGPAFPRSVEMSIDRASGRVTVRSVDGHGKEERFDEHLDLPDDLANGLIPILLKNVRPNAPPKNLSFVVATPKPRVVRLAVSAAGRDPFRTGTTRHEATHFVLKVEIGGIGGLLAPLVGKQPPDSHVWILEGSAPAFVRSQQPLYQGGGLWEIELASPSWQKPGGEE